MKTRYIKEKIHYDGSQLKSLYAYLNHKILGDSCIAFTGGCNVHFDHMVDGEDLLQEAEIRGENMVHFIIEVFDKSLPYGVVLQRLFSSIAKDSLEALSGEQLVREGDDLYFSRGQQRGKLSISIATLSPISTLIHFAVNITQKGTPVKTASLQDLKIKPEVFIQDCLKRFEVEYTSIVEAGQKVRPVP